MSEPAIVRINSLDLLHPRAKPRFENLRENLIRAWSEGRTQTLFQPFETYRSPQRQLYLYKQVPRVTKSRPFESAHNFGFAVDFVPFDDRNDKWDWGPEHDWDFLHSEAERAGLKHPIAWDKPHIEHPLWGVLAGDLSRTEIVR